jgi:hypothetical protein
MSGNMKLSERGIKRLGEIITGDQPVSPHRSGPPLVGFFNEFGTNHTYGQGFPSPWMFAESCIRQFNGTPTLKKIILSALDPRDFMGTMVFDPKTQERKPANLQEAKGQFLWPLCLPEAVLGCVRLPSLLRGAPLRLGPIDVRRLP